MKRRIVILPIVTVISLLLSCFAFCADAPKPTTNKGAVCTQICNFGDVYIPVDGRDQVEGAQGLCIAGNYLYTAVTRQGHRDANGSRPSLYTKLIRTDLKTMEQMTVVTDYYDDPDRIGLGHCNDMTAVTDTYNGSTYTYVLVTRYIRSATLLRITPEGVIDKTAIIVWKGSTDALQSEIASDQMGTSGLAFTSVDNGVAQLLIANKNKVFRASIDLRNMSLKDKLTEAFILSEEDISRQIQNHFGAYGQKYDEGKGSGWGYQGISYDRNTQKFFLPLSIVKDVDTHHEYRGAVLVYDRNGTPRPSEGFVFNETSIELEALDFYGSYLYWDAICYEPIASEGIPEGNRVFRMWTKANFTFDKSTDAGSWTYNKNRISNLSVSDSILSLTPAKVTDKGSPWIRTGLSFSFPQAELFKIKFRIEHCTGIEEKMPQIRFHVSEDAKNWKSVYATATVIDNWFVAAVPITDAMKEVNAKYLEVTFYSINGIDENSRIYVDYIYAGPQWVVPEGHSYTYTVSTTPTASATGSLTGICSACGTATAVPLPKLNTTDYQKSVTKSATCTATGIDTYKWKIATYGSFSFPLTTEAKGHREATDPAVAPTCTETGLTEGAHCSVCNEVLTAQQAVPAKGHRETVDRAVAPTCTESGLTEGKHCSVCAVVLTAQERIPATGHSYTYEKNDALTHKQGCANCDLEELQGHIFTDGSCCCGEIEVKEPRLDPNLKIGHSLNLASDISINFGVAKTLLADFDMSTVYVESTVEIYEGEEYKGTTTVRIDPVDSGYYYYFTLTGLTAVQMNDTITSVFHGTKDGQPYYSNADVYKISDYAYSQLNKTSAPDSLKILCADLLRYGAKAQVYKEYRVSALADANMTDVHRTYLSDIEAVTFGNTNKVLDDLPNAPITWYGKALDLDSKVCLKFIFNPAGFTADLADLRLKVSYKDVYGEEMNLTLTDPQDYAGNGLLYAFTLDALLASELREVVSVQIFHGSTPVSPTLQYSADTYGNNKKGTLLELCKALVAYSDSAKAYFVA